MAPQTRSLDDLQRWMQSVITHPGGVVSGIQSDAAQSVIPVESGPVGGIESVIGHSRSWGSVERLSVYGNAYFSRLLECLGDEFSSVKHAVGEEIFKLFGLDYLQRCPSASYTLGELGRRFPDHLRATRPADVAAPGWPDFLIDLATVERTYSEVFDGPGPETLELLRSEALQRVPPERMGDVVLLPVPSLRLLELSYPAHEFVSAVRQERPAVRPDAVPTYLVVTRRDYVVRRLSVSRSEFVLLKAIVAGESLAAAIGTAVEELEDDFATFAAALPKWFESWAAAGWFVGLDSSATRPQAPLGDE